jgi:hyaluronan synthase
MAFFAAARREFGPLVVAVAVLSYFLTSHKLLYFSYPDLFLRIGIPTVYNILRNPDRLRLALSWYVVPGMFFYNIPLPAIHIWSLVTMTAGTWGTAMRASTEISKDSSRKKWFGWELSEGQ